MNSSPFPFSALPKYSVSPVSQGPLRLRETIFWDAAAKNGPSILAWRSPSLFFKVPQKEKDLEFIHQEKGTMTMTNVSPDYQIYIASLSDYNAGILHGEWINLEGLSVDDIQDKINAILKASPIAKKYGEPAEEWAIHDFELGGIRYFRV